MPILIGPDGVPLKRNNSDMMNNFFINQVTRSFTSCEEILAKINLNEKRKEKRFNEQIGNQQKIWREGCIQRFKEA